MNPLSSFAALPRNLCIITPDFFLLMVSLLSLAHYSTMFIASTKFALLIPIIAKSSAYAYALIFLFLSFSIKSLNIIRNSVGLVTPPYITPLFMFIS